MPARKPTISAWRPPTVARHVGRLITSACRPIAGARQISYLAPAAAEASVAYVSPRQCFISAWHWPPATFVALPLINAAMSSPVAKQWRFCLAASHTIKAADASRWAPFKEYLAARNDHLAAASTPAEQQSSNGDNMAWLTHRIYRRRYRASAPRLYDDKNLHLK